MQMQELSLLRKRFDIAEKYELQISYTSRSFIKNMIYVLIGP